MSRTFEKSLGMHTRMLRRDFMNGLLIGSGGMLLGGTEAAPEEFTGVGDYRGANGNPPGVMQAAHAVRDGAFDLVPSDVIEESDVVDCVIVGGGIGGLATALSLLVWYIFAPQCASTLAVIRRETGSTMWMVVTFVYMLALAYVASLLTFNLAQALGIS